MLRSLLNIMIGIGAAVLIVGAAAFFLSLPASAVECGKASYYGPGFHGKRTASGEVFDQRALTAAMPSRKHLGERYRVTYKGRSVIVRITDTGDFAKYGRIIDLSKGAAERLGMVRDGVANVCLHRVGLGG